MKLATQISILVVAGLAIHGLTQNGMELGRLYNNRCDCCGKPRLETPRKLFTSEPGPDSYASYHEAHQEVGSSPEGLGVSRLPKPAAGDRPPSTVANDAVDPMVQDILEVRRRMGGSSIASILDNGLDAGDSGVSNAINFQQAVREYAEKASYEQVGEKAELHSSVNQGPLSPGAGQSIPDFVRWLGRFRF